ncbi:MAG: hypothetical protein ACOX1A_09345 [Saccharofermentanales bacterium]
MEGLQNIIQINSVNYGSTGSIMLNISNKAREKGFNVYVAYAKSRTNMRKSLENSILIGSVLERNLHLRLAYYTGLNGCFSKLGTQRFLKQVDRIRPSLIQLHNLHNCFINLKMLFEYIKEKNIPVVLDTTRLLGIHRTMSSFYGNRMQINGKLGVQIARNSTDILQAELIEQEKCTL